MAEYRRSAHAVFDLKYHVVWITKYRYKVLMGRVAERTRDLIRQICESRDVIIVRGAVSPDHIHLLLSAPADLSPAKLVQYIKLASAECGYGTERCRAPRLPLVGEERERILSVIRQAIATRPKLKK